MTDRLARLVKRGLALGRSPVLRWGFAVVAITLAVWAIAGRRTEVVAALGRLQARYLVLAAAATAANLVLTGLAWRALLIDLGSRLPLPAAARVFFVGQIGKYVPGSVWPVVVQAELARDHGVPRRRTAAATMVMILLSAATALVVVLAALPFVPQVAEGGFGWTLLLVVPLLVVLHPRVLGPLLDRVLALIGGEPLEQSPSVRGTAIATGWALASWVAAGIQVWLLAVSLGAATSGRTLALAVGGYALAWAAGLVVVIAPAGAGAREVALAAALAPVLDGGGVLVVVLASRVLFSVADLIAAAAGYTLARRP
jgi:uncharacterized membrane protein YbhN (UPF0104 family)